MDFLVVEQKNKKIDFLEYRPKNFDEKKKYPLIVFLHGSGGRAPNDFSAYMENHRMIKYLRKNKIFEFVIIAPQCNQDSWFDMFELLQKFVLEISDSFYIDKNRIYLTGQSMGGYAAWQLLMSLPELFSAAVVCCGGGMYWNAKRIKVPVWAFHGLQDRDVLPEESLKMVQAVNRASGNAKITLLENVAHNCWEQAFGKKKTYEWLLCWEKSKKGEVEQ